MICKMLMVGRRAGEWNGGGVDMTESPKNEIMHLLASIFIFEVFQLI